ncbi:MAG TPA: cardiolipin synthase [Flavobacteriaceae bacterium]|nr:cardiolipin synthase [Flavobacteriaceae bacterium]
MIVNYVIVLITSIFIIGHNRNPVSTLSYILSMIVFPFVGILVYLFFGQEYRKEKMFQRKGVVDNKKIKEWEKKLLLSEEKLEEYESKFLDEKVKGVRLLQNNQKKPLTFKNQVKVLINGEEKFKSLFADLKKAEHHIHVEYYIFNSDTIGTKLIDILCEKVKEGLEVRVSYDYVASDLSNAAIKKMKTCGIEVFPFMPVRFPNLTRRLNYRDHRKIVVIDGEIGYVGGINVCDEYVNPTKNGVYWRDTHVRLSGNAVKSLQSHFLLNWNFVSNSEIEIKDEYFPKVKQKPGKAVQVAASGPDSDWPNIMEAIFTAINSAEKYIYITTPYFIPNDQIITALKTASRSGVEVKLLIPKDGDSWVTQFATDSYIQDLLESGIEVNHYCKGMVHAKTMVIDDELSMIGTSNMDYRSFEINFEITAMIYSEEIAKEMLTIFEKDIEECDTVDLEKWRKRPSHKKWKESFCRLWAPLL